MATKWQDETPVGQLCQHIADGDFEVDSLGGYGGATRVVGRISRDRFMDVFYVHLKFDIANLKVGWKFKIAI